MVNHPGAFLHPRPPRAACRKPDAAAAPVNFPTGGAHAGAAKAAIYARARRRAGAERFSL
jgi:hypothetical protein